MFKKLVVVLTEVNIHFSVGGCMWNMCTAVVENIRDEEETSDLYTASHHHDYDYVSVM